jgi:hypothetical protein
MRPLLFLLLSAATACAADGLVKVVIGSASAAVNSPLPTGATFRTGSKSRSEVALPHGLLRTGSATRVRIAGSDQVALDEGLALVSAQRRALFRRSVQVTTPQHRMDVRGTAQVFHDPGKSLRIAVLEGRVTIALQSLRSESITLRAGQQLVLNPNQTKLAQPHEIDLQRLISSAALVRSYATELPVADLIGDIAMRQQHEFEAGGDESFTADGLIMDDAEYEPESPERPAELVHDAVDEEIPDLDADGIPDPPEDFDGDGEPDIGDDDADPTADEALTDNTPPDEEPTPTQARRRPPPSGHTTKPQSPKRPKFTKVSPLIKLRR